MVAVSDTDSGFFSDGKAFYSPDTGAFTEAASVGIFVTDGDGGSAGDTPGIAITFTQDSGATDSAGSTDGGESVLQTGPYEPQGDTITGADLPVSIHLTATDTASGLDSNGTVFTGVVIFSSDSSRLPPTSPSDSDGGSGQEGTSISASLSDTDTGSLHDGK